MAWINGWDKRIKLTIDSSVIDSALTHYPVLIRLGASVGIGGVDTTPVFDEVGANSQKIAITKSDGTTEIYAEVEQWDDGNEVAVLWASKSDLTVASGADTELYLYYDNSHANNANIGLYADGSAATHAIWDSDFNLVLHMAGANWGEVNDSTSNNNDAISDTGTPGYNANTLIGKGISYVIGAPVDRLVVADAASLNTTIANTMELWVYMDDIVGVHRWIQKYYDGSTRQYQLGISTDDVVYVLATADGSSYKQIVATDKPLSATTWHHVMGAWSKVGGVMRVYLDGVVSTTTEAKTDDVNDNTLDPSFPRDLDGDMDEVRISKVDRGAAYAKANYNAGNDSLITYGNEETIPVVDTGKMFLMFP